MFLHHELFFRRRLVVANPCRSHLKIFLSNIYFCVHITRSSVNFAQLALLSHQKFYVQAWSSLWFGASLNSLKRNIFTRLKWLTNIKHGRVHIYGKKLRKKKAKLYFPILIKIPPIYRITVKTFSSQQGFNELARYFCVLCRSNPE